MHCFQMQTPLFVNVLARPHSGQNYKQNVNLKPLLTLRLILKYKLDYKLLTI